MDNTTTIALIIGAVMPFIITIVKQAGLNRWWNLGIAFASCTIAGVITVWARGDLQWGTGLSVIMVIFVAAQSIYAAFWKDTGIEGTLNDLTSFYKKSE